jgi:uncharacterized protein
MLRFVTIIVGIVIIYLLLKKYFGSLQSPARPPQPSQSTRGEDMVRCVVCGVNVPRSEAILSRGEFFCSDEHRRSRQK